MSQEGTAENGADTVDARKPPMAAVGTFTNFIGRLSKQGVPSIIDRQFIGGSWGSQSQMIGALRFLVLVNEDSKPTDDLQSLASASPDGRAEIYRTLVERAYAGAIDLGPKASQGQLEAWFKTQGLSGESVRKAQTFFLALAKAGAIELSPFYKAVRATPSTPRKRTVRKKTDQAAKGTAEEPRQPPAPPAGEGKRIHPSILSILDKIPDEGKGWTAEERDLLVKTFESLLKLFHPVEDENAARGSEGGQSTDQGGRPPQPAT